MSGQQTAESAQLPQTVNGDLTVTGSVTIEGGDLTVAGDLVGNSAVLNGRPMSIDTDVNGVPSLRIYAADGTRYTAAMTRD